MSLHDGPMHSASMHSCTCWPCPASLLMAPALTLSSLSCVLGQSVNAVGAGLSARTSDRSTRSGPCWPQPHGCTFHQKHRTSTGQVQALTPPPGVAGRALPCSCFSDSITFRSSSVGAITCWVLPRKCHSCHLHGQLRRTACLAHQKEVLHLSPAGTWVLLWFTPAEVLSEAFVHCVSRWIFGNYSPLGVRHKAPYPKPSLKRACVPWLP